MHAVKHLISREYTTPLCGGVPSIKSKIPNTGPNMETLATNEMEDSQQNVLMQPKEESLWNCLSKKKTYTRGKVSPFLRFNFLV